MVHKKVICNRSEFFTKAFTSGFEETKTGEVCLAEDDENAFDSAMEWGYRGTFSTPVFDQHSQRDQTRDGKFASPGDPRVIHIRIVLLPKVFIADKLCINDLMNRVMDADQDFTLENGVVRAHLTQVLLVRKLGLTVNYNFLRWQSSVHDVREHDRNFNFTMSGNVRIKQGFFESRHHVHQFP